MKHYPKRRMGIWLWSLFLPSIVGCGPSLQDRVEDLIAIGDYSSAQSVLDPAIEASPRDVPLRLLAEQVDEALGQWSDAAEQLAVLHRLTNEERYRFHELFARALAGDWGRLEEGLLQVPSSEAWRYVGEELRSAGLLAIDHQEFSSLALRSAPGVDSLALLDAQRRVGYPHYYGASLLAAVTEVGPHDYLDAEIIGLRFLTLTVLDSLVASQARRWVVETLKQLQEPDGPRTTVPGSTVVYLEAMEDYYLAVGTLHWALGETDPAVDALDEAVFTREYVNEVISALPPTSRSHGRLIQVLVQSGRFDAARRVCERVVALDVGSDFLEHCPGN